MPTDPEFIAKIIKNITARRVVPIIGPGAVLITDPDTGQDIPFYDWLAPRLAKRLGLPAPAAGCTLSNVVLTYLAQSGAQRSNCDLHIDALVSEAKLAPAQPLRDLAAITDFQFYVTTCFDPFLRNALASSGRPFFSDERQVSAEGEPDDQLASTISFYPGQFIRLPKDACPRAPADRPYLYHVMGSLECPEYALWEEDQLEMICELQNHAEELRSIFHLLGDRNTSLLLIGTPFSDLIVRLFLRVVKQKRLSQRHQLVPDGVADADDKFSDSMVQYFDHIVGATSLIRQPPADFIAMLRQQWEAKQAQSKAIATAVVAPSRVAPAPAGQRDIGDACFFLSYAREDSEAAERLYEALTARGVRVFLDRLRLQAGANYEAALSYAVEKQCAYFISLVSRVTTNTVEAYYRKERAWAQGRVLSLAQNAIFYIPVIIDQGIPFRYEPDTEDKRMSKANRWTLLGGVPDESFIRALIDYQSHYLATGQQFVPA